MLTLGIADVSKAQTATVPETYESISGEVSKNLELAGSLYVATKNGLFAYDPTPRSGYPRGRFRVVRRGDVIQTVPWYDRLYIRNRDEPAAAWTVFRGFDRPMETIDTVLGPPLELGTVDGKLCIAGERILEGAKKGTVAALPHCLLPSALWPRTADVRLVRVFDGRVIYVIREEPRTWSLWVADGVQPPRIVKTFHAPVAQPLLLDDALLLGLAIFGYGVKPELWKFQSGSPELQFVAPVRLDDFKPPLRLGDKWYFVDSTPQAGEELWRTDGTTEGTRMVADVAPGRTDSRITLLTAFRDHVYFEATGWPGLELHRSDGTEAGTSAFLDLNPRGDSRVTEMAVAGDKLYFLANSLLWESDGTPKNSRVLSQSLSVSWNYKLAAVGDQIYFWADDGRWPWSLWRARAGRIEFVAAPVSTRTSIAVDGDATEKWASTSQYSLRDPAGDVGTDDPVDLTNAEVTASGEVAYVRYATTHPIEFTTQGARYQVFFDADRTPTTGYREEGADFTVGAEYLLQGATLLRYVGSGRDWSWTPIATAKYAAKGTWVELSFDTSAIDGLSPIGSQLLLRGDNPGTDDYLR